MAETSFDIIIVGGGPGGYVAAIRAAQLGMKAAVVERENMGGICLNWGCIPTKALLRTSEVYDLIKHADSFGLSVKDVSYDAKKIVERSRKVANQLSNGVKGLMRKNKITVFDGTPSSPAATAAAQDRRGAEGQEQRTLTAKNVILATGARARQLPGLESDGKLVWTYAKRWCRRNSPSRCW
jgi:Pyruvate/2-oxoglutarate dehydrogenase complex, dihydrolipoamide dehydrogenase (E3) component, and related enzymes